jgi:hypothetical protein
MAKNAPEVSPHGARWILILAVLGVVTGLIVVLVVRRENPPRSSRSSSSAPGSKVHTDHTGTGDGVHMASRVSRQRSTMAPVDRRRLAELLRRSRTGHRPAPGSMPNDSDGNRRAAGPDDDPADDPSDDPALAEDPVFPISAKGIRGAIQARIAEIKECYEGWLGADDTLEGKLILAFTIEADANGELARISNAEIQGSTLEHAGLERCVLVMAESLRMEVPAEGTVTVRYPFRFRSGAGAPPK